MRKIACTHLEQKNSLKEINQCLAYGILTNYIYFIKKAKNKRSRTENNNSTQKKNAIWFNKIRLFLGTDSLKMQDNTNVKTN